MSTFQPMTVVRREWKAQQQWLRTFLSEHDRYCPLRPNSKQLLIADVH